MPSAGSNMPDGLVQKMVSAFVAGTAFNLTDPPSQTILSATIIGLIEGGLLILMDTVATAAEQTPFGASVVLAVIVAILVLPAMVAGGVYNKVTGSIVPILTDHAAGSMGAPDKLVT